MHVDLCELAADEGKAPADASDRAQRERDLDLALHVSVINTQDMLEVIHVLVDNRIGLWG